MPVSWLPVSHGFTRHEKISGVQDTGKSGIASVPDKGVVKTNFVLPCIYDAGESRIAGVQVTQELQIASVRDTRELQIAGIRDTGKSGHIHWWKNPGAGVWETEELGIAGVPDTRELQIASIRDTSKSFFDCSLFFF